MKVPTRGLFEVSMNDRSIKAVETSVVGAAKLTKALYCLGCKRQREFEMTPQDVRGCGVFFGRCPDCKTPAAYSLALNEHITKRFELAAEERLTRRETKALQRDQTGRLLWLTAGVVWVGVLWHAGVLR